MPTLHSLYPFRFHRLDTSKVLAVSVSGDYLALEQTELEAIIAAPQTLPIARLAELKSKFFIGNSTPSGSLRLLASRLAAKKETVLSGPSLHVIVPTLQCEHTCRYCQVSRSLESEGYSISPSLLDAACDTVFESPSDTLTIEFQGGDPLLRFDLVRRAIDRIANTNNKEKRNIRFVVASSLHQLDEEMCSYFKEHKVFLSTSLDGPAPLHNRNRPLPTRNAYERTLAGIELARECIGNNAVSALMTTTRESLKHPEEIVDEYVRLGFNEIFIRPISPYGFAKRNQHLLGYSLEEFKVFYERAFERVLYWNSRGVPIREVMAAIALNKILSPFDSGYVDLQSPTGAGLATIVYNYDGFVYPSDEARMLAETGDASLRLGSIGLPLRQLLASPVMHKLVAASLTSRTPGCMDCAFNAYCGPDPVGAQGQFMTMDAPVYWTDHCKRHIWLFDFLFRRLLLSDSNFEKIAYQWANPDLFAEAA
jgi:His-Xaa-Ser system radical SAM maturase HxsB